MKVCIITPCGTEDDVIEEHIKSLHNEITSIEKHSFMVCFIVDEYTSNKTRTVLETYCNKYGYLRICERSKKRKGLAGCYISGYEIFLNETDCEYVLEMDIESHPYSKVREFIAEAERGFDIVLGSRNLLNGKNLSGLKRKVISGTGSFLCRSFLFLDLTDCTSGFQMFSRAVIEDLEFDDFVSSSYLIQTELKTRTVNQLNEAVLEEIKDLPIYKKAAKKFHLMFSMTGARKWKVREIAFVYSGSASSINYKKILKSFIEFLKLRKDLLAISIMAFIKG